MNAIVEAVQRAETLIKENSANPEETRKEELKKLKKDELIALIMSYESNKGLKVEDLAQPILEAEECVWLDYDTIAALIRQAIPTAKTSGKSIASYASKYPASKGWAVRPRKTAKQRLAELTKEM